MSNQIDFSEDELSELEGVLRRELNVSAVELHRTDHFDTRDYLKHRLAVLEGVMDKIHSAQPSRRVA